MAPWLTVIGIGEDGFDGLSAEAKQAIDAAEIMFGGRRHLDFLPKGAAERVAWPSPFSQAFAMLAARRGKRVVVLASGDPMFYGMGASLTRHIAPSEMHILPAPSSFSLAAARMGWPLQDTILTSVHGRPIETLHVHIAPEVRLIVLSNDGTTPAAIAQLLDGRGFGASTVTVLEHLGGPQERRVEGTAGGWMHPSAADLNVVAIACRADPAAQSLSRIGGLPDSAFQHDGQLTKRDIRAVTLSRLAPLPGELLWDVGAGSGSIGIEWMRSHPACRAIAIEAHEGRRENIAENSRALGVPDLKIVGGEAPAVLRDLETPDAIFIGGGLTDAGVFDACWDALKPDGRLVANAVTLQSEVFIAGLKARHGGELTRLSVAQADTLGSFDTWRTALPVTIYSTIKR
ncbi:bifunctional cobalt-precorrin-7 (C(5))-methyltransferase/cobalt-precorrin-6B (C(15))-methyltransferase [soil metagenome]